MNTKEVDWLTLRERQDHRSRSAELAKQFASQVTPNSTVADLACGTGSNVRFLRPMFSKDPRWLCVDNDSAALAKAKSILPESNIAFMQLDLASQMSSLTADCSAALTVSAFLDMTSADWLDQLANLCRDKPLLAALSSDGRFEWDPVDSHDEAIRQQLVSFQCSDKGFGPALGPYAARYLAEQLQHTGHQVTLSPSDWRLEPMDAGTITFMVESIAKRICTMNTDIPIDDWLATRKHQVESGELNLTVGHVDLLALPQR